MAGHDEKHGERTEQEAKAQGHGEDPCGHIKDPVRKALCQVCGLPVLGAAPFCKDHEAPVP